MFHFTQCLFIGSWLLQHASWNSLCRQFGVGQNGALSALGQRPSEIGIQQYVRQWRHTGIEGHDDDIVYRFRSSGIDLDFGHSSSRLQLNTRWILRREASASTASNDRGEYRPHPSTQKQLLTLLHQYAETATSDVVATAFATLPMDARNLSLTLHEFVEVAAAGYFNGYKNPITITATNRYGADSRPRYDVVEVTVPEDAGGQIASAKDLVRPTSDTALALVVAILTIRHGERETCLLQVQFFRAVQKTSKQKWLASNILARFPLMFYGTPHPQWIALYPIVTLRAPALKLEDAYQSNHYMLYTAQYMSCGLWEELPSQHDRPHWHSNLPRLQPFSEASDSDEDDDDL